MWISFCQDEQIDKTRSSCAFKTRVFLLYFLFVWKSLLNSKRLKEPVNTDSFLGCQRIRERRFLKDEDLRAGKGYQFN